MTPEQIETIRNLRACNVPWTVISRHMGYSVAECRSAIGLPVYQKGERAPMPWDKVQRDLFAGQPERDAISER